MDETTRDLIDRVSRLEEECERLRRRGGRWRGAGAATVLLAGVFAFAGPAQGDGGDEVTASKVTANSFRLRGPKGKLRGMMSVSRKGTASISLLGANQKVRTIMSVGAGGRSNLIYLNAQGKMLMTFSVGKADDPVLVMNDGQGAQTRVSLTSSPAALICNDAAGQARGMIGVSSKGDGVLQVTDANGNPIK